MNKTKFEKYGETLSLDDFVEFAKAAEFKFITKFQLYTEDGLEFRCETGKANKKLLGLKKLWSGKGKKQ